MQGGGAHGAFTWGVLDQLLADGRLEVEGISGASAGALNAAMLADGRIRGGGPEEARTRLAEFWRAASSKTAICRTSSAAWWKRLFSFVPRQGLWFWRAVAVRVADDLNLLNINPLRDVIGSFVDFEKVRRQRGLDLFISATDVQTGEPRIFTRKESTPE